MKNLAVLFCSVIGLIFISDYAQATTWRVNNRTGIDADFTSFSAAQTAASPGDTIHMEGSYTNYGSITVSKRLVIQGTGYFLSTNDTTQAYPAPSQFTSINFSTGSEGSTLYGVQATQTLTIGDDSITIRRNFIQYSSTYTVIINSGIQGTMILQNFIRNSYTSSATRYALYFQGSNTAVVANNIIIRGSYSQSSTSYTDYVIYQPSNSSAIYINNTVFGYWYAYNSMFINNYHGNGGFSGSSNTYIHNISYSSYFGTTGGNQAGVSYSTMISQTGSYTEDPFYTLAAGSPGIGAGTDGDDVGAYGGPLAYIPSGMGPVPAIFDATVPAAGSTTSGINVDIKSKSHK